MRISDWSSDVCSSDLRAVGGGELLKRRCRERFDDDGPVAKLVCLELFDLFEMVGRDDPAPVGFALDDARRSPHGFEPTAMGLGKALAGAWVVPQMRVDRIVPAGGGGHPGNRSVEDRTSVR